MENRLLKKFLMAFCGLVLLPFVLALVFFLVQSSRLMLENDLSQQENLAVQTVNTVRSQTELAQNMCKAVIQNDNLLAFLDKEFNASPDLLYYQTTIRDFVKVTNGVSDVKLRLYVENETIPLGFAIFYPISYINNADAFRSFYADSTQESVWLHSGDSYHYLHKIKVGTRVTGVIEAIMLEKFFWGTSPLNEQGSYPVLYDRLHIYNYSSRSLDSLPLPRYLQDSESGYDHSIIYSTHVLVGAPFDVLIITDRSPVTGLSMVLFGLMFTLFVLLMVGFFAYNKRLIGDIHHCLDNMEYALTHGFEFPESDGKLLQRADEISVLSQRIGYLLGQTRLLLRQKIQEETAAKQAELLALQHQINPHFLYNTMEVFSARMELAGLYEESSAIAAFCKMLRYNINTRELTTTLENELRQVNYFLAIQRIRNVPFSLQVDISDELRSARTIRFLLEPFIENSFKYRGTQSPLCIRIAAHRVDQYVVIQVQNNGELLPPDRMEELNRRFKDAPVTVESSGDKIGLTNINSRLKLFYGEEHYIRASCEDGKTTFAFSIAQRDTEEVAPTDRA